MKLTKITLLKIAFWLGAAIDALAAVGMLSPSFAGARYGIANFNPGIEYRVAMSMGAALMAGWTLLLIWASFRPAERRDVLLLTVFPVVVGMIGANIYAVAGGMVQLHHMIPSFVMQGFITVFYLAIYIHTRELHKHV